MLEDEIQKPGNYLFWFSLGGNVMDQRGGDGRFIGWIKKTSRSVAGNNFPNFEMLDAKIASALNKIIQNSHFKKKVSLEEQKEDRFLRGRQIALMIYDNFRVTGARDSFLDYADFFSVTLRDDNVQDFDTRWDDILLSMSEDSIRWYSGVCLYKLRIRESAQFKTVLELYDMDIIHQKVSMPNYQRLKTMVKNKYWSETSTAKFWRQTWENRNRCSGQESQGIKWCWKRKRYLLQVGGKGQCSKGDEYSFRHESNDRAKPTPKAGPPSEPQSSKTRGKSVSRKRNARGRSRSEKFNRPPSSLNTSWKVLAPNRLVNIGILPNVNSFKRNRDVSSALSAHSRIGRLKNNQTKRRKGWTQKCSCYCEKCTSVELCVTGHWAARFHNDF